MFAVSLVRRQTVEALSEFPVFQYTISTISPPPDEVKPEYIGERLHDETAEDRLLRFEF